VAARTILHKYIGVSIHTTEIVADLSTGDIATLLAGVFVEVCLLDGERGTSGAIGSKGFCLPGSGDLDQSFEVTGSGDNRNQGVGIQGVGTLVTPRT
jgi:hypothetical protein